MFKNKIAFIFILIPAFLFLQGCQDNIILPETANLLQAPRLLYPPDDTTGVNLPVTFKWSVSRDAITYRLQVSTDSLLTNVIYDTSGLTKTNHLIISLAYSPLYYWRVSATNRNYISKWSDIWKSKLLMITGHSCYGILPIIYFGKTYNTVQIGRQCWLRENLDVGTMIHGSDTAKDNGIIEKYCYNDSIENCNIYGGLYQWNEAMQYTTTEGSQGICPTGWHIPELTEFRVLRRAIHANGNALKAIGQGTGDGAGTNTSGFSALLAGYYNYSGGYYFDRIYTAYFWSSTEYYTWSGYGMSLYHDNILVGWYSGEKGDGLSIRCLKD